MAPNAELVRLMEQQIETNMKLVTTLSELNAKLSNGALKSIADVVVDNRKSINKNTLILAAIVVQLMAILAKVFF